MIEPTNIRKSSGKSGNMSSNCSPPQSTSPEQPEQRVAASGALARLAQVDPATLNECLPVLVEELRRQTDLASSFEARENHAKSRTIRANLVEMVSHLIIKTSETAIGKEAFNDFVRAVTIDIDEGMLRVATRALFASVDEGSRELASVAELLD